MSTFQVAYNATTKTVKVQNNGATVGSGFTNIGTFHHFSDVLDELEADVNHVLFHHVRKLLYAQGILDPSSVTITVPVGSIDVLPATQTLDISNGDKLNLATTFSPPWATNKGLTYASSDATKATVDANGMVKPVAAGTATITITSADTGVTDTVAITVQA